MTTLSLPEYVDSLPNLSGSEDLIAETMGRPGPHYLNQSGIDFANVNSGFSQALHMHQPLIPAGGGDLRTAEVVSNLQDMFNHPDLGDNHNAGVFHWCYKRIGEFIPELVDGGVNPRIMLEYSGCLLHGLRKMGLDDVFELLGRVTCDEPYRRCVEWLGMPWGHPVAPSTPMQDFRLHVRAFQHHFAGIFGLDALSRVRGFSPSEMALPNHPDVAYEFVRILKECGYLWVMVQEHTVEMADGDGGVRQPHIPHRLVCRNSKGETASIIAVIKTQGSDTKLVAQAQPYYEAMNVGRTDLNGREVPQVVTQIADGENGGVMMNEFPEKYKQAMREASGSGTVPVNTTEWLEYLASIGLTDEDYPAVRPIMQGRIWEAFEDGAGPEAMAKLIDDLKKQDDRFHMEGGSWTNDRSWVQGYDDVLGPMEKASAMFAEKVIASGADPAETRYRNALYHLLMSQTSCYRYWGEGQWTDFGKELCRRTMDIIEHEF